jgi:hypothetical protein
MSQRRTFLRSAVGIGTGAALTAMASAAAAADRVASVEVS